MRQLDESLTQLAERGERVGADVLLERVEHRLALGTDPTIVALDPRRTGMQMQEETAQPQRTRGPWLAAAAFGLAIVVAVAAVVAMQLTDEESLVAGQPPGTLEDFVTAVQDGDAEAAVILGGNQLAAPFLEWIIALDLSGAEFRNCKLRDSLRTTCSVSAGPNWFYSRIVGHPMWSTFSTRVLDDRLHNTMWDTPPGLVDADAEFEAWVIERYPERYATMFAPADVFAPGNIRFGTESGLARMELLEEFLASR